MYQKLKLKLSFISWQRQNQLVEAIAENVSDSIFYEVQDAHIFSVSIDTTFDELKKEQYLL